MSIRFKQMLFAYVLQIMQTKFIDKLSYHFIDCNKRRQNEKEKKYFKQGFPGLTQVQNEVCQNDLLMHYITPSYLPSHGVSRRSLVLEQ